MIANHKGEIPFVVLLIPFLLGLIVGLNLLSSDWLTPLAVVFAVLCTFFILLNLAYKRFGIYKIRWLGGALMYLLLFISGCLSQLKYNELSRNDQFSKSPAQYLLVKVNNEPVLKNSYLRFIGVVEQNIDSNKKLHRTSGNLLINIKDSLAKTINYGDELLIPANYKPIDPPFNPGEFNYKRYLADQNIHYQAFLYHGQYTLTAHNAGNPVIAYALQQRQQLVEKLKLNMDDTQAVALASTLILGYRTDLSNDVLQAYSKTGTVYVLTVSGAQVSIIYFMLTGALAFLNRFSYGKLLRALIILAILWYYALLTGLTVSVCRAVLMVSIIVTGKIYSRYINSLNVLAISAFLLLLYDPLYITDVGFQLAYIAVAGLIIFRPMVYQWLKFKNKWADRIWELCSVSIAAQLVTFPLSAYYFHQFPVYFLISNLFAFIPAAIIMYAGIVYLLLPQLPYISKFLGTVMEKTILLMNKILAIMEQAPLASVNKIWLTPAEYLLLYAIIISLFCCLYYKRSWLLTGSLFCLLLLSIMVSYKKIANIRSNTIAFLNMRKNLGIVLKNGNNAVVISDLTDTDKNYQYSVQPYLDSSQVMQADIFNLNKNIRTSMVLKQCNFIQFLNKNILLLTKQPAAIDRNEKLNADYIYLYDNPYEGLDLLNNNYNSDFLINNAGNSNHFTQLADKQAKSLHLNFINLKRNKSFIVVSN